MLVLAKQDVERLLQITQVSRGYFEFQSMPEKRYNTLKAVYDKITIV